ncbi:uncharacterized protein LOC5512045 isoform X2 [Nematostella vectensis]|uniref:uncharacterized protein LOC5512045 isoform X2 n=1 Tax=Nematostella vectensis TaxID=45351 RepID=UPI002076F47F|nr:uncharacterized protein LOC5512045 isoform X2 [Nematostella vectensis]
MSFGGRSFRKEDLKKELRLLAKKSQTEFATLQPNEKAAILEESTKVKLHDKKGSKSKKKKPSAKIEEDVAFVESELSYAAPSPSVDLELDFRVGTPSNNPVSARDTGQERPFSLASSQKVASIKAKVDLNVVMQGKSIDGDRMSKASSVQSKPAQANTVPLCSLQKKMPEKTTLSQRQRSAKSQTGIKSPEPPAAPGPKPAILSSQNSTMQIQLVERELAPAKQPERSLSKASRSSQGTVKSAGSVHSAVSKRSAASRMDPITIPEPSTEVIPDSEELLDKEQFTEARDSPDYLTDGSKSITPIPREEANSSDNEYDHIHSEIMKMTQTLSMPDVGLMNLLNNQENKNDIASELADLQAQALNTRALLQQPSLEQGGTDFSVIGASKSVSPRLPQTPKSPGAGRHSGGDDGASTQTGMYQSYVSPMKTISEVRSRSDQIDLETQRGKESKASIKPIASREWTGLVTHDSNLGNYTPLTEEKAREALELSLDVQSEDVINVAGQKSTLVGRELPIPVNNIKNMSSDLLSEIEQRRSERKVEFLGSWSSKDRVAPEHNVHHFCTLATEQELPPELHRLTRDVHTPDRFYLVRQRYQQKQMHEGGESFVYRSDETLPNEDEKEKEERRLSLVAHRILQEAMTIDVDETMERLKKASDDLFFDDEEEDESLQIAGVQITLKDDTSRLYWTPAPPKMGLDPDTIRSYLYPEYQGAAILRESLGTDHVTLAAVTEIDEDEEEEEEEEAAEERQARKRTLNRAHGSLSDLTKIQTVKISTSTQQDSKPGDPTVPVQPPNSDELTSQLSDSQQMTDEPPDSDGVTVETTDPDEPAVRFVSVIDQRRQLLRDQQEGVGDQQVEALPQNTEKDQEAPLLRRAYSEPLLDWDSEKLELKVASGYDTSIRELNYQKDVIAAIRNKEQELDEQDENGGEDDKTSSRKSRDKSRTTGERESVRSHSTILDFHRTNGDSDDVQTETESMSVTTATSLATGVSRPPKMPKMKPFKRKQKRKSVRQLDREQRISEFKMQPAHKITRSRSFHTLSLLRGQWLVKAQTLLQSIKDSCNTSGVKRGKSLPSLLDFNEFVKENSVGPVLDEYDWVREQYWYKWFDEVYPPSTASPQIQFDLMSTTSPRAPTGASKSSGTVVNSAILDKVQVIEPEISSTNYELYMALKEEADKLDVLIEGTEKRETLAMYLCRRGAIHRKVGELKKAWDDLNKAIELENMLLDAYWHRHLLYLLQNNKKAALDDLTFIIKHSSSQARAYRSRAELYRQEGDATMAIVNYSQAIKLNPNDVETYYQRAAMFKMRGDMLLALEDYKIASRLLPSKTEAMFEIGMYRFNNENWTGAVNDFTEILEQDPQDSRAYTYRGTVFAKMGQFSKALPDLAAGVHYNPDNAVAFYQRGCILRKIHPRRALQDFSVSLLLDDSEENVMAFMHRGILYTDLKRWEDAIPDFEAAIRLDPSLASAYVNIGLIYIIKHSNYQKAIRQYTSAIRVDPTYVRALICRAEAFQKMGMLQEAILDYARAIHMRPDVSDYHMARGKLLLEQKKLDLASFHVKQAAQLNQGLGASATQQAVVHSFLKNFDQAIDVLERATRVKPSAQIFVLLGKTNMKAKRFEDAISSFLKAIEILTPWNSRNPMPLEAAGVYFLIGMCQSEVHNDSGALDAYNEAIKVNPDYAEAFYQRGLTKMKLSHTKGVHDFNRALAINPKLFQAFLSRAAYYGMKGRYSKGIMSCNEAIKLQPQSVRAYLYRGALKYHIKAFGLAVKDLTEAVAIDCRCSLAYFNRAVCHHEMKYFQKALMDYGTVMLLETNPNLKVLQNRGLLYLEIGDIENALEDFKAAAKVSTLNPKIRHTLGLCYHKLNKLEEAVAAYDDALKIDPFFVEAYNGRGNALMDFGHEQGNVLGRRDYLKALHLDPLCLSARVNLAYNLQVEGKFQAAWNQFSAAIAIDSTCQAALEGRAVINLQMGNTFGAFVDMNEALKISKTAELLNNRGVVQQYMGDYVNAVRDYQAAIRLEPSYALSYYNAGNVYFRQRQFKQALSYFNKALSWIGDDESAVLNRAITKVMLRDAKGAIQDFNLAVELNPYAAHVYFNRANLYTSLRKYKEAEEDYTRALSLRPGDALVYKRRGDVMGKLSKREAAIQDYTKAIIIKTRTREGRG